MIYINTICDFFGIRSINYNNTIIIHNDKLLQIVNNLQMNNLFFTLTNFGKLYRQYLYINIIGKGAKSTHYSYSSSINLNKKLISLHYYYIYIIKKYYYLNIIKEYFIDFYTMKRIILYKQINTIKLNINTMKLNKNVALII
jgi:hypothetical protein